MKPASVPKELPLFPGNSFTDPYKTKFNKTHILDVKSGTQTGKNKTLLYRICENSRRKDRPRTFKIFA